MSGEPVYFSRNKSFTRRSRDLTPALERQFASVRDQYVLGVPRGLGYTTVAPDFRLDLPTVFGRSAPLFVEIGSGRGEQVVSFAAAHPDLDFLAFEVWVPGIARLAVEASKRGLSNVKVIEADAEVALKTLLPEASVTELWTFFPDPWRKARHHKRRLVSPSFTPTAARVLQDGGTWRLATDWADYAEQMRDVLAADADFELVGEDESVSGTLASPRFPGRVLTHFEERAHKDGRPSVDFTAVRLPRQPASL